MANKSYVGWLIPAAILTLPGFMFYFWWSHVGGGARKAASIGKLRGASVQGVFNAAPPDAMLSNPISALGQQVPPTPGKQKSLTPHSNLPQGEKGPRQALAASLAALSAIKKSTVAVSEIPSPPEIKRDPTLSPEDRREIQDRLAPKFLQRKNASHKKKGPPIETLIDLEGIVFVSPTNVKAIINGNILRVGQLVNGAKIVNISQNKVIFSYKGRQFVKVINGKR
jgi:hypothetical protein